MACAAVSLNSPAAGTSAGSTIFSGLLPGVSASAPYALARTVPVAARAGTLTSTAVVVAEVGVAATRPPPAPAKRTLSTPSSARPLSCTLDPTVAARTSAHLSMQRTPVSTGGSGVPTPPPPLACAPATPSPSVVSATAIESGVRHLLLAADVPGCMLCDLSSGACGVS